MTKKFLSAIFAFLIIICSLWALNPFQEQNRAEQSLVRVFDWDRIFTRKSGWLGGDVAGSFIIPGNRVLWVFGDSFIGRVKDNKRVNLKMVNNSVAIHPYAPDQPGKAPLPCQVHFYWGAQDFSGKPTAWIRPKEQGDNKTWYWPTGGGVVLGRGTDTKERLALFLIQVEKKSPEDSVWGFKTIGSSVAIVENLRLPVRFWNTRIISLPHQIERRTGDHWVIHQLEWGVSALSQGSEHSLLVLIYGCETKEHQQRDLVLARVNGSKLEDFRSWEFYAGNGRWERNLSSASTIANDVASELSVERVFDSQGLPCYVMIYSEPFLGDQILVRLAQNPEGPWSEPKPIFRVPEVQGSQTRFAYAGKGHYSLSPPRNLLVSYVVNSHNFQEVLNDTSIYLPKFILVPFSTLGIP